MRGRRRERLRVESRVHDTNLQSVGEQNRCQVGPTILFECPAQIPRSFLRSFSLWARHPGETSAELNVRLASNAAGQPRPPNIANQWAASFGGPVKKDRMFFFLDTEGLRV